MSNDQLSILLGIVIIPWCAWVTTSIFNLRTQTALFKAELKAVERIEMAVQKLSK